VLVWLLQLMLLSLLATLDSTLLRPLSSRFVISIGIHSIFHLIGTSDSYTVVSQVLNIPTKINKGTVEIITPVELIKKGDKVGSSEAALLAKLGIRPFSYGLVVLSAYDNGSVFSPEVLDLTEDDLVEKFATGVALATALSLAVSYPTLAAAPHMFINGYKNVLAVAIATEYSFPQAEKTKEFLKVLFTLFK
jgi:large subunit ribosomal protein LP0